MDMKAGRELDALIEEKIFERCTERVVVRHFPNTSDTKNIDCSCTSGVIPRYSTNITDAWKVVEKFDEFYLEITRAKQECFAMAGGNMDDAIVRDSMPLAICLSALKAVGYED